MATNARTYVTPPPVTPSPYGLLSVVDLRGGEDPHWANGVTWQDMCPTGGTTYMDCLSSSPAVTGAPVAKTANASRGSWGAVPFTVYAEVDCSAPGFWDDQEKFAREALDKVENWQLERAFWTGTAGGVANAVLPHLAATAGVTEANSVSSGGSYNITLQLQSTIVTGSPLAPAVALGALEDALGDILLGQAGVIHVPNNLVPVMAASGLLIKTGPRIQTHNGNFVVAGNGYPRTGPDGSDPGMGHSWMFATGPLFGYRSGVITLTNPDGSTLVRTNNTVKAIAERTYLIGYDCANLAVLTSPSAIVTQVAA